MQKVYFSSARTLRWDYRHSVPGKLRNAARTARLRKPVHERRLGGCQDAPGLPRRFFVVYNDGIVTVITFAALYAKQTIGFTPTEILLMFIAMNVIALLGAVSFGWIADRLGQKRTILISLGIWLMAVVTAYFSYSKTSFYVVAALAGIGMGSCQSVTRSLVAVFTPRQNAAEFAGFLGFAGKAVAFLGPLTFGTIAARTGTQRPAILAVGAFFLVGMILLCFVNEQRGKEASRIPIDG